MRKSRVLIMAVITLWVLFACQKEEDDSFLQSQIPDSIVFTEFMDSFDFTISNSCNYFSFELSQTDEYFEFLWYNEQRGSRYYSTITIKINRECFETETYYSTISLAINNSIYPIEVVIENFKEEKQIIKTDIVDAEYSKITNKLVYVSENNSLNLYNPATKNTLSMQLVHMPTCISLSLDGMNAVVGHDGYVTYVDLQSMQIINIFTVSCYAFDIVLGSNKWIYVFPLEDQWENIRCIDIDLAYETLHTGWSIYAKTRAKLYPSGKFIGHSES